MSLKSTESFLHHNSMFQILHPMRNIYQDTDLRMRCRHYLSVKHVKHTNEVIDTLWLVSPIHSQKVHRYTSEHDDQSHSADHRLRVQAEAQQQDPEQEITHRNQQTHLCTGHEKRSDRIRCN